jgi:hypothetical protein
MKLQTTINELNFPIWIEQLFTQLWFSCSQNEYVHLRQNILRDQVIQIVETHENGNEELRQACHICLQHDNKGIIERGIACLFVIGSARDISFIEPLLQHPEESVRKAARTCIFEIKHRAD